MNASALTYNALSNHAALASLVGSRITPIRRHPTDHALPAVTYQVVSTDPGGTLAGDTVGLDRVRVQIDTWAKGYAEALAVAAAVRTALRGDRARYIDEQVMHEDETGTYHVASDFYVWSKPE